MWLNEGLRPYVGHPMKDQSSQAQVHEDGCQNNEDRRIRNRRARGAIRRWTRGRRQHAISDETGQQGPIENDPAKYHDTCKFIEGNHHL
jgi:hypothetical protein